jgi:sugar/nucleoside kinase (ribokinase family)
MFADGGSQLTDIFRRVKSLGLIISLDMVLPDPNSPAGRADWLSILQNTLPYVDIFLPSLDEILYMLGRTNSPLSLGLLTSVSGELLAMGAKMVVLKLGGYGLYLHTAPASALQGMGRARPSAPDWADYENYQPCFQVDVAGTTGSGDSTIAGFLAALLRDLPPDRALDAALGVGACSVESPDALSGIRPWDETLRRIESGWARSSNRIS